MKQVFIVPTQVANLASLSAAFGRLGAEPLLARLPEEVLDGSRLVLPGVGALGAAAERLKRQGLWEALGERLRRGKPTLAVCVGLQLLCRASEESPGVEALGLVPAEITRFRSDARTPHMGWNRVEPEEGCRLLRPGHAYFANSYRLLVAPAGFQAAWSEHGGRFVAGLEREGLLACQFHPELSGEYGQRLLARWLAV